MSKTNKEVKFKEGESAPATGMPEAAPIEISVPESLTEEMPKAKGKKKKPDFLSKLGRISVKPYVDATKENMGLENYGFSIFPGTAQEEQLAAIEKNGVVRYITGLDEFAPEVQRLDEDMKQAVIRNIRYVVAELEKQLATNVIKDLEGDDFWDHVTTLKPNNHDFWKKISLRLSNDDLWLNPKTEPMDLIKFMAIEAGGFDLVAKSLEDARTMARPPKFYLDKEIDTVATRTEGKKLRNRAISILDALFNKNTKKLFYVTKVLGGSDSTMYKNSTPPDTLYDVLDEYIHGNGVESNKKRAAESFIDATKLDMETLKLKALIKDASFYNFIVHKPDGMLYHAKTSAMLGRNVSDIVEYLKNPLHEDVLADIMKQVEEYWNQ